PAGRRLRRGRAEELRVSGRCRQGARRGISCRGPKGNRRDPRTQRGSDRLGFQRFVTAYDRKHRLEGGGGKVVLYVGDDDYPLPIPLVPDGPRWFWDTDAGDDEILYRRVGRNELATIQVCLAYVDAQREYYSRDRGAGILEYAQHLESTK